MNRKKRQSVQKPMNTNNKCVIIRYHIQKYFLFWLLTCSQKLFAYCIILIGIVNTTRESWINVNWDRTYMNYVISRESCNTEDHLFDCTLYLDTIISYCTYTTHVLLRKLMGGMMSMFSIQNQFFSFVIGNIIQI